MLHAMGARITVCGRKLFDWEDTLAAFRKGLDAGAELAVFTHTSNVFGYVLPVEDLAAMCRRYGVPFVIDAAQSAGSQKVDFTALRADFIAMPGHKGLLGPQGTGILLCKDTVKPLLYGGTGSASIQQQMPQFLPDRLEAGTVNVPGIAGLGAALAYLQRYGIDKIGREERIQAQYCAKKLKNMGYRVFSGDHQCGTVSFVPDMDCEELAGQLGRHGIGVRAGLHCAPLAHESAGTLDTGTVRFSFGYNAAPWQSRRFLEVMGELNGSRM
jgi:selenocysteine lyase/cysteine desulfurase